jgi:hypothetical protein
MNNESLDECFNAFNEIQTGTNINHHLDKFLNHFDKKNLKSLLTNLEEVFMIIIKNFDKNNIPLKNIKNFLKKFITKIVNIQNKIPLAKEFICHFCSFFTQDTKKSKYRSISLYFLSILN